MAEEKSNSGFWIVGAALFSIILIAIVYFKFFNNSKPSVLGTSRTKTDFVTTTPTATGSEGTFNVDANLPVCKEDGKPVVYLISTTWCPHCKWIKDTYDKWAKDQMEKGNIIAYHWEIDIKDDTLTEGKEGSVPSDVMETYQRFNPRGSIPTFIFGCKYWRIGNGFESQQNLELEEKEFQTIVDKLLETT